MASKPLPDAAYLRQCFEYDPEKGTLRWLSRPEDHFSDTIVAAQVNTRCAGKECRSERAKVYFGVRLDGQALLVHRVVWKIVTGLDPIDIDHADGDTMNNAWKNLREATAKENSRNMKRHADRGDGRKGTHKFKNRWFAYIWHDEKQKYLGTFRTEAEAHSAYCRAAKELFGQYWNPG